jgi:hypothetical protein
MLQDAEMFVAKACSTEYRLLFSHETCDVAFLSTVRRRSHQSQSLRSDSSPNWSATDNQSRSMGANFGIPDMNSIGAQPCEPEVRKSV